MIMADIEKVIEELNNANKVLIGTDLDVVNGIDIVYAIDEAIRTIRELQEQIPKLHMVADGDLPQILQTIIVYTKLGHYHLINYYGESECFGGDSLSRAHNVRPETVIAWMELPKFKGEE